MDSDNNQSEPPSSRRRTTRTTAPTSRAEALERLRSLRRGERRPQNSYQFKIEDPIYDTVDEDEYSALVAKRKSEFSDFVVEDENGDSGLGYRDDGEEEDWTKVGVEMSDGEGEDEEELEVERRKRKKTEKKEKEGQGKRPSGLMMAAEAIRGKQRISSMFTSSVFKRRGEDKGKLGCDSIVDDVIAEFAPDEDDRERRKRGGIGWKLGLGGVSCGRIESRTDFCSVGFGRIDHVDGAEDKRSEVEHCGQLIDCRSEEKGVNVEERNGVMVEEVKHEKDSNGKSENGVLTESANVPMNEVVVDKATELVERNSEPKVKEEEKRHLNAKFEERKDQKFNAAAEWQAIRSAGVDDSGVKKMQASPDLDREEKSEFELESDGSLPFYILDAHEEIYGVNTGVVYLFGKVKVGNTFHSCCVIVKNLQRCVYAIPNDSVFRCEEVIKIDEDLAQSKISADDFRVKLQGIASGLKQEIANKLVDLNVSTFSMAPVKRNYAFDRTDIPVGENYVLKINYPFKDPPIPSDLKGNTFRAVLGTHSSALELFLVKREIKGPSWLSVSKFSSCPSNQKVSWCKFEIIVDCPKDIQASTSSRITAEIPPVVVTAINLKTVINGNQNVNEIISASIISCTKAKIDSPMLASEWKTPGVLSHFTVVRKLEGGIFPMGFTKDVSDKNAKGGSNSFGCESSERALLNRLMIELYKLDSDVIVGHNISGFDLDVLLQRAQACKVPSSMWSRIGRLKRSVMPKLTKGSRTFGSGASPGIMSCIAGRVICDTFLCSRDLLKEVSYSLTHLAKSQLNKDRKEIAPHDIPKMFETSDSLMKLVEYNETDAWLSMELMFHLSVLPLTRQLTNISGNLWGKTLQGARAQRVEYLLLHAFHGKKYIVPDKYTSHGKETKLTKRKVDQNNDMDAENANAENEILHDDHEKGKKGPAYAGGLVLEPKRGLYDKYILLLDFNSLYPSIIQEYNICFTTVERPDDGSIPRLPSSSKKGVLPELLKGLVERRRKVKNWLKNAKGLKAQQFDIQQQALKLTANSMYGCLGFSNSRFYAKPLAELITLQGREILQSTVDLVRTNLNLEVIYGDTDSIMIHSGLDDFSKAKEIAGKVIQEVNKKYRCLEIDLDGMYKRMLLLKKKKYAAVKVQFKNDQEYEIIERKGLDMVRRDWSLLSKELGDFCLSQILSARSCEDVVESIHNSLMKVQEEMRNGEVALEKYVITKTLTKPPEAYPDAKNQPHVQVALRLKQSGYSSGSSAGDTVPYVICCEQGSTLGKSAGIAQRARHPDELKHNNENWMIDIEYYLSQQIHPVVSRLCACIQGTSPARLADCLGLDPTKFQSRTSDPVSDEPPSLLLSSTDDEERYVGCQPLTLFCPSCSCSFECPIVSSSISKLVIGNSSEAQAEDTSGNFWQKLQCPKCPTEGENGQLSAVMIANQVKRQAEGFISLYYRGLMTCDDETCKYTTRSLNLRVIGDSERGTVCPNYPHCNGRLVRKYSEADLYKQLQYFCHVLDTVHCIQKMDATARVAAEKELARVEALVELAASTAQKMRDRCAYGWVYLKDLFVSV
ncbi:hypothetical protein Drorol1_Dr00010810 [Drosera rotundifolia]